MLCKKALGLQVECMQDLAHPVHCSLVFFHHKISTAQSWRELVAAKGLLMEELKYRTISTQSGMEVVY